MFFMHQTFNVFHYYNGIIDQQTNRQNQGKQGKTV
ncbi:Uncharacterised protein [Mycobacteroides abscessus]|nr:Uncharacterised protein [Mycobacteroides abscessus]